ncbi:ABC transporter substrate-binding protein [Aliiroseovarius lamellibrachiae]|uniref:ABC transporter substrate-binding protein n=1 Tax=Aliiroseovarius lamellibrachiae TaxID=1924933 RepID=UPI001BDFA46D|nr:ABC transporter substrate-binding protein [Aliiroseovarius lamellibrachiae]MBT2131910.1 twin-arginine translocation signal domain-containing protein [Aliiroseovarius lamellibrachiae]
MSKELEYLSKRVAANKLSRRDFLGRASALGVSAAAANTMLSGAAHAAGPVKGGTLKIGMNGGASTDTLDPGLVASQATKGVLRHWGDTLVNASPTGELDMRLAESIESSPDAKVWHFNMRQGVEFHNGKTMTAEDAMKTIERHSNEESKSGALGIVKGIESMSVSGNTLSVTLDTPNADLPYLLADYHLVIQPNGGMDDPNAGIGTGPYTVEVNEPGVRYGFKKFANHWDESIGHAAETELLVLNDATARMAALQSGQVHMVNSVEPKVASLLDRAPGISVKNVSGRGHYVFIMHTDTAPFDNKDLRLALKYAINRQEMVDKILKGYGGVGNDMPINASYPLFDETIPQREYDPEKAAEHYKASGHDGSPIILRVADAAFPGAVDAAQLFQQSAAAAGIPLEIKREPNDGYWSEVWNKQPFCASYWGGRPVQDQMYSTAYLSTADWNDTRFNNPEFDSLLSQAKAELDPAKRKALYSQMGHIVRDEGGLICPMFNDFVDAVSDKVGGFEPDPNGELMDNIASSRCWLA